KLLDGAKALFGLLALQSHDEWLEPLIELWLGLHGWRRGLFLARRRLLLPRRWFLFPWWRFLLFGWRVFLPWWGFLRFPVRGLLLLRWGFLFHGRWDWGLFFFWRRFFLAGRRGGILLSRRFFVLRRRGRFFLFVGVPCPLVLFLSRAFGVSLV